VARKTPKKQPKNQESAPNVDAVAFVTDCFKKSWTYTSSNYHSIWEDAWKLYNNKRVKVSYLGITDTFVPMTFSTVETLVSALAGSKPQFDFIPPYQKQDQDTKVLNALLDYYWDKDQWNIKIISWIRSSLLYGTGIVYVIWDENHPCLINVPLRDFIIDPEATSLETASYIGRRYLTTLKELKSFKVTDPETGELVDRYKNLDQITNNATPSDEQTDKEQKDMFYGSTVDEADKNQIEVLEIWTDEKRYSIANRSVDIEANPENPHYAQAKKKSGYSKGIIPFATQRDYIDESLFYGKGEVETFKDEQELLNDLTNQNTDAITFALNPMWNLHPDYADQIEQVENLPGAVYPFEPGKLAPVVMPVIPNNAFNERINIKNEIRETTATDQIVKGGGQNKGDQTATEVQAQVAGAAQRFGIKVTQLENEGFHRLARIVFDMIRLYVTKPQAVRIAGKDGISWEEFNPEDFADGDYEPRVQLQTTVMSNKQADANKAKEMLAALIADPEVNKQELYKIVLPRIWDLDPDEISALFQQDKMNDPAALAAQAPPAPPPKTVAETLNYKDAPEDVKREIEAQAGLTPSKMAVQTPDGTTMVPEDHPSAMPHELHDELQLSAPPVQQEVTQ
jgi:hypothetical protein